MEHVKISNGTSVIIADGRKALFLRNEGDDMYLHLAVVELMENAEHRATHDIGTDRPGRTHQSADMRRGAIEETDFHEQADRRFTHDIALAIDAGIESGKIHEIVLVAAPRTLAILRKELPARAKRAIIAEVNKEVTNRPVSEIEKMLKH
jgi:protein required for attachment to host cells